jgi:hypothetical protein
VTGPVGAGKSAVVQAALILDEFALWLNLSDVYWQRQGRESYEAMALFGSVLGLGLFGAQLFRRLVRELFGGPERMQKD